MAEKKQTVADYSDFQEPIKPTTEAFTALNAVVEEAKATQIEINDLAQQLAAKQEKLRGILYARLPNMMKDMGLSEFKTSNGLSVKVKDQVKAHINKENMMAALQWLEDNGHGAMIKRAITVGFNKGEEVAAQALLLELASKYKGVSQKKGVHNMTLEAWVRNMLNDGKSVPMELFGVREFKIATIPDVKVKDEKEEEIE